MSDLPGGLRLERDSCSLTIRYCLVVVSRTSANLSRIRLQEFSGAGFLFDIALRAVAGNGSLPGNECGQATKGIRWMSWRQESMKDVAWLR